MGELPNYVNMSGYCEELCVITAIKFNDIEKLVNTVFVAISNGEVDAVDGLVYIDTILTMLSNPEASIQQSAPKELALTM